jgi:hypothetical protein
MYIINAVDIYSAPQYVDVSKSFRTESIMKNTPTKISTRCEATQRVMVAKLTRLTHKVAIQLNLAAESCPICSSRSRLPVQKLFIHLRMLLNSEVHHRHHWTIS